MNHEPKLPVQATKPNFSGTWKLSLERSFDPLRKPQFIISEWVHEDPYLEINHRIFGGQGEIRRSFLYYTDGRESLNQTPTGEARTTVFWRDEALIMVTTHQVQGHEIVLNHRYTLIDGNRTIVMDRYLPEQENEIVATLVFERSD